MRTQKTCFLAAPFGASTDVLVKELQRQGFRVRDGRTLALPGTSVLEEIRAAVRAADLMCAVLPSRPSPNAYLEIGLAVGLAKPVALFAEIGAELPSDLAGLTYCRAGLQDGPELARFLSVFLKHYPKKARPISSRPRRSAAKLGEAQAARARNLLGAAHGLELEKLISDLLSEVGYVVSQPYGERKGAVDFAVWIDALQATIGNPVPVEVKANISTPIALREAETQLRKHLERVGTKLGLLVYAPHGEIPFPAASPGFPIVVRLSGARLIDLLEEGSFESEILRVRNQVAHGTSLS